MLPEWLLQWSLSCCAALRRRAKSPMSKHTLGCNLYCCSYIKKPLYSAELSGSRSFAVTLKSIKTQAYQIVFWQLMIIMGLAAVVFLLRGIQNGIGTLLGGLAYWLPTLFFVWRVFSRAAMKTGRAFIMSFLAGEVGKLFLSALLFVLILKYLPMSPGSVVIGFVCAIVAFWISSFTFLWRHPGVSL